MPPLSLRNVRRDSLPPSPLPASRRRHSPCKRQSGLCCLAPLLESRSRSPRRPRSLGGVQANCSCSAALRRLPAGTRVLRHSVVGVSSSATQDPASADDLEDQPLPDANMDPEEFSHYALHLGRAASDEAWRECIRHLCDLLKSEPPSRGGLGTNKFSWSCGVYFHANKVGLRTNTNLHPNVCKLLCEYFRRMAPDHPFTSLMLDKDPVGRVHADKNNATGLPNAVLKISSFERGGLWIESPNGTIPCPDQDHAGTAWSGDSRITLVAFSIHKVARGQQRRLGVLGFAFPNPCADPSPRNSHEVHGDQQRHLGDLGFVFPDSSVDPSPSASRCPTAGPVAAAPHVSLGPTTPKDPTKSQPAGECGQHESTK